MSVKRGKHFTRHLTPHDFVPGVTLGPILRQRAPNDTHLYQERKRLRVDGVWLSPRWACKVMDSPRRPAIQKAAKAKRAMHKLWTIAQRINAKRWTDFPF